MKLPFIFVVTCAFGPSAWAQSGVPVLPSVSAETVASVQEHAVMTREVSVAPRLRDAFQPANSKSEEAAKPYRLTSEERLRLREQVRGQFAFETAKQ